MTGTGAAEGQKLADADPDAKKGAFEYDDEIWLAATFKNAVIGDKAASGNQGKEGALLHGKLVFSLYPPEQVTFYQEEQLKNLGEAVGTPDQYERLFTE